MSSTDCEQFRGLMALRVVGQLSDTEQAGLAAHLDGCHDCRQDMRDLTALAASLPEGEPGRLDEEMPAGLTGAVLGRLHSEVRRERWARGVRYGLSGAVAAAVVTIGLVVSLSGGPGHGSGTARSLALSGDPSVHASVRLTSEVWGTAVQFEESGQAGGQDMWVWMRTTSGTWWEAGTYRSVTGHRVEAEMACALSTSHIASVWVKDAAGHVLLHSYLS